MVYIEYDFSLLENTCLKPKCHKIQQPGLQIAFIFRCVCKCEKSPLLHNIQPSPIHIDTEMDGENEYAAKNVCPYFAVARGDCLKVNQDTFCKKQQQQQKTTCLHFNNLLISMRRFINDWTYMYSPTCRRILYRFKIVLCIQQTHQLL